jgi:hypothetical protein
MIGAGPQWGSAFGGSTKAGIEVAGDFMFWPSPDRKLGRFLEPSYSCSFIGGQGRALARETAANCIPRFDNLRF